MFAVAASKMGKNKKANNSSTPNKRQSMTPTKSKRRGKKITAEDANTSHKLTEYFPVRRSCRKPTDIIKKEKSDAVEEAILTSSNEKLCLEVFTHEVKGRGVKALKPFTKDEFVVEYRGDLIDLKAAKSRTEKYEEDPSVGSYMYYFEHKNVRHCVDATAESPSLGRLVNHSRKNPNCKTKVVEIKSRPHLVLVAKRDIEIGEELLYDYGENNRETRENLPWLDES